jgi:Xrn1 helical domain
VQVPFVDEQRLLTAAKSVPPARLTEAERTRNKLGDMLVFEYKDGEHCNALVLPYRWPVLGYVRRVLAKQLSMLTVLQDVRLVTFLLQAPTRSTTAPRRCPISLPACSSPTAGACGCRRRRRCLTAQRASCLR